MVIPRHLADEIAAEGAPMELFEDFVLDEILRGVAVIGLYPPTDPRHIGTVRGLESRTRLIGPVTIRAVADISHRPRVSSCP